MGIDREYTIRLVAKLSFSSYILKRVNAISNAFLIFRSTYCIIAFAVLANDDSLYALRHYIIRMNFLIFYLHS